LPFFGSRDRSCSPTTSLYPPSARARSPVVMSHGARALATLLNERSQIKRQDVVQADILGISNIIVSE
jgi:hypothetical protein